MNSKLATPIVSVLGVLMLTLSACGGASAADDESMESSNLEAESAAIEGDAADEVWVDASVPFAEEHLPDGVAMPEGCLDEPIYVEDGAIISEEELLHLCPAPTPEDRVFRPSQQLFPAADGGIEFQYIDGEEVAGVEVLHLHCEDSAMLEAKEEHNGESQPEGWPQEWGGDGAMPDPYCHPDYLEIGEWEHLEAHSACWEGTETSTLGDHGQPQDEIDQFLWEQSQARADWEPNPAGGTCAEQWAEHDGGAPEDYADTGNTDPGA